MWPGQLQYRHSMRSPNNGAKRAFLCTPQKAHCPLPEQEEPRKDEGVAECAAVRTSSMFLERRWDF
jgi:hypothetical protein